MAKDKATDTKVTRISASDPSKKRSSATSKTKLTSKKVAPKKSTIKQIKATGKKGPMAAFIGYFTGAWYELNQVHWPTRRATWGLTIAVIAFTAFFVIFILLLDIVFKSIFEQLLK